ncbi:hypothetical protein K2F40_16170 [Clostridium sp. CM028]|uniref:tetratricopeptide repeat protein n=1 Tax=Clostridium sp. CM028 TaxID=2851575 RepID=UPI001C6EFA65|nr:hypothetical protein [Clostridium sp. CM028]MBW9150480.1 hypothetical protein [Clostridium sp. CM028]WLC62825.1 hypothetical protein KTC94_06100 [Clostridium sp. CM028]
MAGNRYTNIRYIDLNYWFKDWPIEIINGSLLYDVTYDNVVLQLKICNISNENISSVYISVECFDDAGDKMNENNNIIIHSYQDLDVKPNNTFGENVAVPLINKNVRKVNIHVQKVVYKNGDIKKINKECQLNKITERTRINVLGDMLIGELKRIKLEGNSFGIEFIPETLEGLGWLCCCGRLNNISNLACCRCGRDKTWQFDIINKVYLEKSYNDYQIYQEKIRLKVKKEKQRDEEEREEQIKIQKDIAQKKKYKMIQTAKVSSLLTILLFFIIFASIRYIKPMVIKNQQYGNAIKLLNDGKYNEALLIFENLLHYKNADEEIKETHYRYGTELLKSNEFDKALSQLQQILKYKDSKKLIDKTHYQFGRKLMNDKDYLISIENFNKITKGNVEFYSNAQENIEECKKQFIKLNVTLANEAISSKEYDNAEKYINELLKLDSKSADAKKLKSTINSNIAEDNIALKVSLANKLNNNSNGEVKESYLDQKELSMSGAINRNLNVHMKLFFNSNEVSGTYYYDKYKTDIILKGVYDMDNNVTMNELDNNENITGVFKGKIFSNGEYIGSWSNLDGTKEMPFAIKLCN